MSLIERLKAVDCSKVKRFSFDGVETYARVANIYDPDTFTIVFEYNGEMVKTNIRLNGLDSPEKHSLDEFESQACLKGIEFLNDLIGDKIVRVCLNGYDKYGRVLGNIFTVNDKSINDMLIDLRYARSYSGGKKLPWTKEELDSVGCPMI